MIIGAYLLLAIVLLLMIIDLATAKTSEPPLPPLKFSGQEAFQFLYRQCELGPRNPGSPGHKDAIKAYVDWFEECGADVRKQTFTARVPRHFDGKQGTVKQKGTNIIAEFGPIRPVPDLILCAHFDTRPWADKDPDSTNWNKPIIGANDGASGVAVLLEMARLFNIKEPQLAVTIVLFDLEDSGISGNESTWCLGSAHYGKHYAGKAPSLGAVLLDMVGEDDIIIPMEYFSFARAQFWTETIFNLAEEVNSFAFEKRVGNVVYDDHVNLLRAGIPTVNLIDFDYPYWHTVEDTPDKCSPDSLEQVGRVLVKLIYNK